MGKNQQLQLPAPPTFQTDPTATTGIPKLGSLGTQAATGDFTGDLSWLSPTVNVNNGANALSAAQGILQPQFRDTLQQINNNAAANGQMNSSTYSDALARSQSDLNSQYQSIVSQQAINDSNQSNANRLNIFGTGLNTLQSADQLGLNNQGQQNQFNLDNYQNLVAQAIQNNQNANSANGWQQAIGMLSPIGHDYLQSQGINSVPGYGVSDIAKIAGTAMGFGNIAGGLGNTGQLGQSQIYNNRLGLSASGAGINASNNPFMNNSPYSPNYNPYSN